MPKRQKKAPAAAAAPALEAPKFILPKKRICIATPTYSGSLSGATLNSLLSVSTAAHANGWATDFVSREGDSCIQRARCYLFTHFLDKTDCTDLLFLDADVGCSAEGFVRLMSFDVDVVGGAYRARGPQEHYILRPLDNELQRKPPHGLMEVEGVGTGFLRITRDAARKMVAAYPDDWYTDPTCQGLTVRDMFSFSVENHYLYSEDYNFCRKWRAIGGKVWVDPDQVLDHVGYATFRGCLMRWLEGQMPKIPDHVPAGGAADWVKAQQNGAAPIDAAKALLAAQEQTQRQ